jgi:penicillin-binding protein 1A
VQGASTITQQVVKQLLLTSERSFERKGKEMILAVELDSKLTKDEIFYLYLNHIYFGARSYGLVAAAREFFNVEPQRLSLAQAALLAGPPAGAEPLRSAPQPRRGARPPALRPRPHADGRLHHARAVSRGARRADRARHAGADDRGTPRPGTRSTVRTLLEQEYGSAFATLGLQVNTAVDLHLQTIAEEVLHDGLRTIERQLGGAARCATCRRTRSTSSSSASARAATARARSRRS